jgi:hypothetical protein
MFDFFAPQSATVLAVELHEQFTPNHAALSSVSFMNDDLQFSPPKTFQASVQASVLLAANSDIPLPPPQKYIEQSNVPAPSFGGGDGAQFPPPKK